MLGGSSSLNYMLYVRGNKRDYDNWGKTLGNTGWSYDEVLPYFIKSEDNQNPYLAGTKYHGKGGYLTVTESAFLSPLGAAFIQGGVEMGYNNNDGNGEFQTGSYYRDHVILAIARSSILYFFFLKQKKRIYDRPRNNTSRDPLFNIKSLLATSSKSSQSSHFNEL